MHLTVIFPLFSINKLMALLCLMLAFLHINLEYSCELCMLFSNHYLFLTPTPGSVF